MKSTLLYIFICISICSFSQVNTVGVRYFDPDTSDGYTLFTPEKNTKVYLINNCGEVINEWDFDERPGLTCYLLENGNLLRAGRNTIDIRDWDNNLIWSFDLQANGFNNQHHDIEPLPNGNVLCLLADNYPDADMVALGKIPSPSGEVCKLDKIIELEPSGLNGANLVWEWKLIDHIIQDHDNSKPNFGVVGSHPELIDINYAHNGVQNSDFSHINSVDYNADLDQILLSARSLNEIYIIDHSTTTAEAASHTGGNFNSGGDILWRWGNPLVYDQGTLSNQKLFSQHDAKWVASGYLDEGKISVFNNGGNASESYSAIHLITPEIVNDQYTITNSIFNPQDYDWSWNGNVSGELVYQAKKSGAHSLPNGNIIFCQTSKGQFTEISKTGQELWTYKNPTGNDTTIFNQFDTVTGTQNSIFRAEKYPSDYIGFAGKDLTPQGIIEDTNSITTICQGTLSLNELYLDDFKVVNPVYDNAIKLNATFSFDSISIIDIHGKTVFSKINFEGDDIQIDVLPALYFIKIEHNNKQLYKKIIVK